MSIDKKHWLKLAKAIQGEKAIMGYRNTAENLEKLYREKLAVAFFDEDDGIVVFGGLWNTIDDGFLEAGSFWVHSKHRNKKYSSEMFQTLTSLIPEKKTAILITHVDKVVHLMEKNQWTEVMAGGWEEKVPFRVSCGPCDVVSEEEKKTCIYRGDKKHCRMFLKVG